MDTTCACGRVFTLQNAFTNHTRTCPRSKKHLSAALESAKEKWTVRKRRRVAINRSPGDVPQLAGIRPLPNTVEVVEAPVAQPDQVCYTNNEDLTPLFISTSNLRSIRHQIIPILL